MQVPALALEPVARVERSVPGECRASTMQGEGVNPSSPEVTMRQEKVFAMPFATLYPLYVRKAESKGRSRDEVDQVIRWLTGYTAKGLQKQIESGNDLETFFDQAPALNPHASLIKGLICGIRVEDIEQPLMQKIRYLDKLVDELARGKAMEKILRKPAPPGGPG